MFEIGLVPRRIGQFVVGAVTQHVAVEGTSAAPGASNHPLPQVGMVNSQQSDIGAGIATSSPQSELTPYNLQRT
jgi:hypothetical protein